MEELKSNWNWKCQKVVEQQQFLHQVADIDYDCFYKKMSEEEWFNHHLWNYLFAAYGIQKWILALDKEVDRRRLNKEDFGIPNK